jgi:subtilisin family serine protease
MKKLTLALSISLLGALAPSFHLANAQTCSSTGAYMVDASGKCVDLGGLQPQSPAASSVDNAPKTYIAVFKRNAVSKDRIPEVALQMAQKAGGRVRYVYQEAIQGTAIEMPVAALPGLQNNPLVERVEADQAVKLVKPAAQTTSSVTATSTQEVPWGITRVGGFADGTGKTAWVIDTGIDLKHPDLRVDSRRCFTAFKSGTEASLGCNDGNGHGTHVAGTIAALNNTIGVVGVAAGATVVPVKVLESNGGGTVSGVVAGIDYVAAKAMAGEVANMSLGGAASTTLDNAILSAAAKGIKFVLAAGNESQNANNVSPARVNGTNIFTISAFGQGDAFAWFSNFGNPPVDYAAPGVDIKSTWKGGGYATLSGTSMATPHAAGILLLGAPNSKTNVTSDPDGVPDRIIQR